MKKQLIVLTVIISNLILVASCDNEPKKTATPNPKEQVRTSSLEDDNYLEIGKKLTMQTKASLANKLQQAIASKGYDGAVEFCNIQAIPITDSISLALNAKIRRVSDKPRNKTNQAKDGELFYIEMCKKALEDDKELKPFISENEEKMIGYYPIVTNQTCLNCHGQSKEIGASTLAKLNELYPADEATNYKANEVRGLFVVEMNK